MSLYQKMTILVALLLAGFWVIALVRRQFDMTGWQYEDAIWPDDVGATDPPPAAPAREPALPMDAPPVSPPESPAAQPVRCLVCHRVLRGRESIQHGTGRRCRARIKQAAAAEQPPEEQA